MAQYGVNEELLDSTRNPTRRTAGSVRHREQLQESFRSKDMAGLKRHQVSKACARCRRLKLKCTEEKPCRRCARRKEPNSCQDCHPHLFDTNFEGSSDGANPEICCDGTADRSKPAEARLASPTSSSPSRNSQTEISAPSIADGESLAPLPEVVSRSRSDDTTSQTSSSPDQRDASPLIRRSGSASNASDEPAVETLAVSPSEQLHIVSPDNLDAETSSWVNKILPESVRNVRTSCSACLERQRRCDGSRPCKHCAANGDEEKCSIETAVVMRVERPFATVGNLHINAAHQRRTRTEQYPWLRFFLDYGVNQEHLVDLFRWLPPRLQCVYRALSGRFENAITQAARAHAGAMTPDTVPNPELWQHSTYCGWMNMLFDEHGNRSMLQCNKICQGLWGAHLEEIMARSGSDDLPLATTEFRWLCLTLDECLHFECDKKTRFVLVFPETLKGGTPKVPVLFRETMTRTIQQGVPRRMTATYVPASPDEATRAMEHSSSVRNPFEEDDITAVGAVASGPRLYEAERIETMVATPEGRRRLEHLATKAIELFGLSPQDLADHAALPAAWASGPSPRTPVVTECA